MAVISTLLARSRPIQHEQAEIDPGSSDHHLQRLGSVAHANLHGVIEVRGADARDTRR